MFDVDEFVSECREAIAEGTPQLAIKDVIDRTVSDPGAVAEALPPERAGIERLHNSPELTVLKIVWAPGMYLGPHDHRMWACIGLYTGGEDNAFYRRDGSSLAESGGKELRVSDVTLLGDDTIHAVTNPTREFTGAIHVYGGDFFSMPRSEWTGSPFEEHPYDVERVMALFEEANARAASGASERG